MDKLAVACGLDPVEIRLRNAMRTGDRLVTGQVVESVAPVARCITETAALPMPPAASTDAMARPGGAGLTADAGHIRRGVGFAVAIKNLMYSEGFDDYSTARCRLADGVATLKFATAEVGQGFVTIAGQIARTVLGVDDVVLEPIDTQIGSAGSTSASRQTWMSGGAVDAACRAVRERLFEHVAAAHGLDPLRLAIDGTDVVDTMGPLRVAGGRGQRRAASSPRPSSTTIGPPPTSTSSARATATPPSPSWPTAPSSTSTSSWVWSRWCRSPPPRTWAWPSTRCRCVGQIEGGIAQGLGLAVMEEIVVQDGRIRNPQLHRLPPAHLPRRPRRGDQPHRGARPAGAPRGQGRGRAAVHLGDAGHRGRHPGGHRAAISPGCPSGRRTCACKFARWLTMSANG